jgi:hypothetical protein
MVAQLVAGQQHPPQRRPPRAGAAPRGARRVHGINVGADDEVGRVRAVLLELLHYLGGDLRAGAVVNRECQELSAPRRRGRGSGGGTAPVRRLAASARRLRRKVERDAGGALRRAQEGGGRAVDDEGDRCEQQRGGGRGVRTEPGACDGDGICEGRGSICSRQGAAA